MAAAAAGLLMVVGPLSAEEAVTRTVIGDQFSLVLPAGWSVYDQSAAVGAPGPTGLVIFSVVPLTAPGKATAEPDALVGVDRGDIPSFIVDRQKAERGMACGGLSKTAVYNIGTRIAMDPALGALRRQFAYVAPRHEEITLGGCKGVKFRLEVHQGDAQKHVIIDVRAVSDGQVLYLFGLRNRAEHFARNIAAFEAALASLQIPPG